MFPVGLLMHIGLFPPDVVPPTDVGSTTTCNTDEYAWLHDPLWTRARNSHVPTDPGVYVYVVVVLFTLVHVADGNSLLSHLTTEPVCPESVMVVLEPIHIGVVPLTDPPTERGLTVTAKFLDGD